MPRKSTKKLAADESALNEKFESGELEEKDGEKAVWTCYGISSGWCGIFHHNRQRALDHRDEHHRQMKKESDQIPDREVIPATPRAQEIVEAERESSAMWHSLEVIKYHSRHRAVTTKAIEQIKKALLKQLQAKAGLGTVLDQALNEMLKKSLPD